MTLFLMLLPNASDSSSKKLFCIERQTDTGGTGISITDTTGFILILLQIPNPKTWYKTSV